VPELELWLPASYIGGDPRQGFDSVMARAQAAGPGFAAEFAHQSRSKTFVLKAMDTVLGPSGRPRIVVVNWTQPALFELRAPIETLLKSAASQLSKSRNRVLEVGAVPLPLYQAGRIVSDSGEEPVRRVQFAIKGSKLFWFVTYAANVYEFGQALPVFEQSIRTLRLRT
jgi:hypothetical protein